MSDYAWFCVKNMVVFIGSCLCMYYISGWCFFLLGAMSSWLPTKDEA